MNEIGAGKNRVRIGLVLLASSLVLLTSLSALPTFGATTGNYYSGRAIGLSASLNLPGTKPFSLTVADTGPLPTQGGQITATPVTVNLPLVQANILLSVTKGAGGTAQSDVSVVNVKLLGGLVTADSIKAESIARCPSGSGSSAIINLKINGLTIVVSGKPNQQVVIPGVLTLVINEQVVSAVGHTYSITVNALDLTLANGAGSVVIASAHSDLHNDLQCNF